MRELIAMMSWALRVVGIALILFVTPLGYILFGVMSEGVGVSGFPPPWVGAIIPLSLGVVFTWLGLRLRRLF